jgi:hypothetical protein
MSAYTPGPYRVCVCEDFTLVVAADGVPICRMGGTVSRVNCEANATLLHAAPELAEALAGLLTEVDAMTKRVGWSGEGFREKARAALAKVGL